MFFFFSFFSFLFFSFLFTVVLNKDKNGPNNPTSCPTDYTLTPPPCRKPCAMTIWSKISNTFDMQLIHHLVVRNMITFFMRDVQNKNKMKK